MKFVLFLVFLAGPAVAQAQTELADPARAQAQGEETDLRWDRRVSMEGRASLFGPYGGFLGGALEYAPVPNLAFSAGGGAAVGGWRATLGMRPQVLLRGSALGLDLGVNVGPSLGLARVTRLFVGYSHELRAGNGFRVRFFSGYQGVVSTSRCRGEDCAAGPTHLYYVGLAIGWALPRFARD